MVTFYNNSLCKQAELYHYDFLCNENIELIPKNIIEHIGQCPHCQEKIHQLNTGLSSKSNKSEKRQVTFAITDLLNLHLAYIGDKVVCKTVKPFLPVILDPNLGIRIPTPITVHLDHCQQCAQDLKTIRSLNLTCIQSCRLSQLLADKATEDAVSCSQAQAAIPAVASMAYQDTNEKVLKHLCTCQHCRQDLYEYRETIRIECQHEKGAQKCSICDQLTMNDVFDFIVPYGLDPTRDKDAISRSSITKHSLSCAACLAKIQTLHNTVYGIVERAESEVATIYHIDEFSKTQEPGKFDDLYAGYPISVEVANREDIDTKQAVSPIHFIDAVRQKVSTIKMNHILKPGIIAVAVVLIAFTFFFKGSVAGAVTLEQIYTAIERAKNVYISTFAGGAEPVQERWISRTLDVLIIKTGEELTLWNLTNNQRTIKTLGINSVQISEISDDLTAVVKKSISGSLGLMPFNNISDLPWDAKWNPVSDYEHEATINNTEIYELTWTDKSKTGTTVFSKWRFTIDPETNLPLKIQCYRKSNTDAQFTLNSRITVQYLENNAMQTAIEKYF